MCWVKAFVHFRASLGFLWGFNLSSLFLPSPLPLPGTYNQVHGSRRLEESREGRREEEGGRVSPALSPLAPTPPASRRNLILGTLPSSLSRNWIGTKHIYFV